MRRTKICRFLGHPVDTKQSGKAATEARSQTVCVLCSVHAKHMASSSVPNAGEIDVYRSSCILCYRVPRPSSAQFSPPIVTNQIKNAIHRLKTDSCISLKLTRSMLSATWVSFFSYVSRWRMLTLSWDYRHLYTVDAVAVIRAYNINYNCNARAFFL